MSAPTPVPAPAGPQFDVDWVESGPRQGMAQGFNAQLTYRDAPGEPDQKYDLRVNHPLKIGDTEIFLIGHGYAPIITVRDGNGDVAYSGPTVFLPENAGFRSFGVLKASDAKPTPIGLEGLFFPTYLNVDGNPVKLTSHEYRLLAYLMHQQGKVVSRTELVEHIYDQDFDRDSNTIEVFIGRLRKKLGVDVIQTVRGLGYILQPPTQPAAGG